VEEQAPRDKTHDLNTLDFFSLNVCSIRNRLIYVELIHSISKYDIIGFTETKLDDCDVIKLPGYAFYAKHRHIFSTVR
jgi:exonuclease III